MNVAIRDVLTVDQYLAWASTQGEKPRTELINGHIVAMSPERAAHNRAKIAVLFALRQALSRAGVLGEVFTDGMTVPIDDHTAYGPDALVRCGVPLSADQMKVTDPVIVVEIRSPTTERMGKSAKLIGYFRLPSVCHYLFIDPDAHTVLHHSRAADGTIASRKLMAGMFRLDPPGLELGCADLFG